ncbi:hypothetical protein Tco_0583300 [Tanacetum coccineum]
MLRKQHKVDASHYDMPLIYYTEGHSLHFGRPEFALITGLPFGHVNFGLYTSRELKFRNRVFPHKLGLSVTNLDVIGVIEDEEIFQKLCDQDSIRLCLILCLEVIIMGRLLTCSVDDTLFRLNVIEKHSDDHYFGMKRDRMYVHMYTFSGFVFAFQVLIFESFERCNCWWIKDPNVIPRAVGWSKKSIFNRSDCGYLFAKESTTTSDIRPTKAEYESSWWIRSQPKKWIKDEVISQLNLCVFKLETIIQVLARERKNEHGLLQFKDEFSRLGREFMNSLNILFEELSQPLYTDENLSNDYLVEEELRLCLEAEERMRLEHEKNIIEEQRFRVNEAKRMKLEEEKLLEISDTLTCGSIICSMGDLIMLAGSWSAITLFRYFCKIAPPLFDANGDKYATSWSDVDQVFFPINETAQHWYVVPTSRVVVPTGRYVVPAGKVILIVSPGRLNLVPTSRILSPGSDNDSDDASVHSEPTIPQQQQNIQPQIITTVSNNNAKFPYLNKDEYEKVIQNGNSLKRTRRDCDGRVIILPPTTTDEHIAIQRESKARTTLLQSIPDDHVADFHYMDDARDIWNAVKASRGIAQRVALTLKTKGGHELLSFDDLYYKLKTLEVDIKGYSTFSSSQSAGPSHSAFVSTTNASKKMSYLDSPCYSSSTYTASSNSKTGSYRSGNIIEDVLQSFVADTKPEQQLAYEDFD